MEKNNASGEPASFKTQMNALMRKNATLQRRSIGENIRLIVYPVLLCLMLRGLQSIAESVNVGSEKGCSTKASDMMMGQMNPCPELHPPKWPVLFQVPLPEFRAVRSSNLSSTDRHQDLPPESCRNDDSCPVSILHTGQNRSLAQSMANNLLGREHPLDQPTDYIDPLSLASNYIMGKGGEGYLPTSLYFDPAFNMFYHSPLFVVQQKCKPGLKFMLSVNAFDESFETGPIFENHCILSFTDYYEKEWDSSFIELLNAEVVCSQSLPLWRNSAFRLFPYAAYDFKNTDARTFNVSIWHNETIRESGDEMLRILRARERMEMQLRPVETIDGAGVGDAPP